jgi:hypothetical protein
MRRVKTRIVQPRKSGAPGLVTFTDSAALSDELPRIFLYGTDVARLTIIEYRIRRHGGDKSYA